ncbi:MAG: lycopene cyclase [Bacteroidetes bacterium]|nr:lycopene cyclase [Bacteroidota bacterium]
MDHYNYIIAGAGCSGLSLAMHMIHSGKFSDKKILLVDKVNKTDNDRTWCFWEKEDGLFESIVYKRWEKLWYYGSSYKKCMNIVPYQYKMIRGLDFYNYCFDIIAQQKNISILTGSIKKINSNEEGTFIICDEKKISGDYIFSSLPPQSPVLKNKQFQLLQHFKGWVIETDNDAFNSEEATLMDFRVSQENGTNFFYVMPFSSTSALVEYTLITERLLDKEQYDICLKSYIKEFLRIEEYNILEEEFGVIPMTNNKSASPGNNILNIGTAGGQTKASTGYTFQFIQKQSRAIVKSLIENGKPPASKSDAKFDFYDSVLLNVLATSKVAGEEVFTNMFRKNKVEDIFSFLDSETNIFKDLKIISSFPFIPFLKAGKEQLF